MESDSLLIAKQEAVAGIDAAYKLRASLKNEIKSIFETTQGNSDLLKSTVTSKMNGFQLERLIIKMPHYGFKQHFGFEGVKKNGVKMRLLGATNFLNDAVSSNKALEDLATKIGELRSDTVIAKISF